MNWNAMSLFNAQWLAGCIASPVPSANEHIHLDVTLSFLIQ